MLVYCRLVPLQHRKVVLYMSRNGNDSMRESSRRIRNEELLIFGLNMTLLVSCELQHMCN
jgi:hypothetical protein